MGNKHKIIASLILFTILVGCQNYTVVHENDVNYPTINPMPEGYQVSICLFFPQKEADILVEEVREVNLENKKLEVVVIEELLKGSRNGLRNVIPSGTKLLSIHLQGSVAYVNFNKAFIDEKIDESEEVLLIYSIVNSLTAIEDIEKVQILIEGEKREKYNKHKLNEPIDFSNILLEFQYSSPEHIVKEYYGALLARDFRKMFGMESANNVNETRYNIFATYYESKELGLIHYEIDNLEIIKYDNETIIIYGLNLYYTDGRIIKSNWMEMKLKYDYEENQFLITTITNYEHDNLNK
ncbi:hypothetical protein DW1_2138 [Proteiniborus sp. DW1]|uniref:GerMN domain-containing protein n=1 Tax=Proteiniborus sp. DW1 TaxID=1889883 RepID=UPI00092E05AD|nr:GerMN domain-containing protein [Proteiniborus sp. DW1]SCG83703.1 hypothetical protein DW1_2138 [Proteiniborus sp. DW1]